MATVLPEVDPKRHQGRTQGKILRWPIQTLPSCIVYCIDTIQSALYRLYRVSIQAGGATYEDREGLPAEQPRSPLFSHPLSLG